MAELKMGTAQRVADSEAIEQMMRIIAEVMAQNPKTLIVMAEVEGSVYKTRVVGAPLDVIALCNAGTDMIAEMLKQVLAGQDSRPVTH